jgi:acetolactate synthase I/II/III large subunit
MYQEVRYPGRVSATDIANPDFTALARSFGLVAQRVEATAEFGPALAAAFQHVDEGRGPALIEIITDVRDIAPGRTIS